MDLLKIATSVFLSLSGVDARLDSSVDSDRSTEETVAQPIGPRTLRDEGLLLVASYPKRSDVGFPALSSYVLNQCDRKFVDGAI